MQKQNSSNEFLIRYQFTQHTGKHIRYDIRLDENTLVRTNVQHNPEHDKWTRLEHHQCENCPLSTATHKHCPAAVAISELVDDWSGLQPHDEVHLHCRTERRKVTSHTSVQDGLGAILGLLLATSECPHFDFFKPMARFHLPLSTPEEAYFRVLGSYFIKKFVNNDTTIASTLDDVRDIYENIEFVNRALSARISDVESQYATTSAIVVLDLLAQLFNVSPTDSIDEITKMFKLVS